MEYHDGEPLRHMGDLPAMTADRYGEKTALIGLSGTQSFTELNRAVDRVGNVLTAHGFGPGDRIGLFVPNTLQFPSAYFGAMEAGLVPVPLNLRMDRETLGFVIADAGIDCLIASPLLAEQATELASASSIGTTFLPGLSDPDAGIVNYSHALAEVSTDFDRPERAFDDVACQPYTSGTTGDPKGVLLTHENLLTTIESYDTGGLPIDPDDTGLLVLPLFHIYALNALMGTFLYTGATQVLHPQPEPVPMFEAIEEHDVTRFAGVPAMYTMLHRTYREAPDAYDLSSLKTAICAAAPLADATRNEIESAWNVRMTEGWGMTETAPAGTTEPVRGVRKEAGCIGPPVPNIELKLADPDSRETIVAPEDLAPTADRAIDFDKQRVTGEIAVRGPQVFAGYHDRPEKTEAVFDDDGWFYTGDIARVDRDGYFWIVDRADDMMIVGGENVYPAGVEDALYAHPAVAEAAVVAVAHEVKGEAPVAFVVTETDVDQPTETTLRRFVLDRVAAYAHPRRVFFVEELPRSATRKVQRFKLETAAADRLDGPLTPSEDL